MGSFEHSGEKTNAVCIAGTHSGCGKTTVTLGIMAGLMERGLTVQPFKVGPDFIDPGHHRRVTGRVSHNLDGWMLDRNENRRIFRRYNGNADTAVIEGVMGLYDGFSGVDESGSTAQMAKWLDIPVILVIDARSMARSAAAVASGYVSFDRDLKVRGVIFNRVGSESHAEMLRQATTAVPGLVVLGCLPREQELEIPSRHLGLVTDEDYTAPSHVPSKLSQWIETHLDLDALLNLSDQKHEPTETQEASPEKPVTRIGIARDEAFCFYYAENLRRLEAAGAQLVPFSPLRDPTLPHDLDGLYLGGGYPELYCRQLSENRDLLMAIKSFGLNGGPIYGECGGFMFLMDRILDQEGKAYPMVGLFGMLAKMEPRLRALGYREVVTGQDSLLGPAGTMARGHEFHYSVIADMPEPPARIYRVADRKRASTGQEGFLFHQVLGSYVHLHFGSNPQIAESFTMVCRRYSGK